MNTFAIWPTIVSIHLFGATLYLIDKWQNLKDSVDNILMKVSNHWDLSHGDRNLNTGQNRSLKIKDRLLKIITYN